MYSLSLPSTAQKFPFAVLGLAYYVRDDLPTAIHFDPDSCDALFKVDGMIVTKEYTMVRILGSRLPKASVSKLPLIANLPKEQDQIQRILHDLNEYLVFRTFLAGTEITVDDWITWGALRGSIKALGLSKNGDYPHLFRWFSFFVSLDSTVVALSELAKARRTNLKANTDGRAASFDMYLADAVQGQVVTRFPPEPSGYLHIGHIKAAILNDYFARRYNGKLIIRFDDTNPTKEKEEYERAILEDLDELGIHGDIVTHSSDYFPQLYDFAVQLIKSGKAYVDDTNKGQMSNERNVGLASANRNRPIQENLALFDAMKSKTEPGLGCCLRAKISVDNPNKAMRDPVIYRSIDSSHPRTGRAWRIYPTYDFACPVIDSLEGVSHALRSNEYRDRNATYNWILDALRLRRVHVWDFSRLNFVYTPLSKRALRGLIDNGLASGWDDPRFPTFRGIRRRGMTVEALRQFMFTQGPSQNQVLLEWDSIWAMNKKIIDPIAPRFSAVLVKYLVRVSVVGIVGPRTKMVPKHKKVPSLGVRQIILTSDIVIEQDDAAALSLGEEIVLMNWGIATVTFIHEDSSGTVDKVCAELQPHGDKKKARKITWVPDPHAADPSDGSHPVIPVTLLDFGHLITKPALKKGDNIVDWANPSSEICEQAWVEGGLSTLRKGDVIQLERKGYYSVDSAFDRSAQTPSRLIRIPDGKAREAN